MSADPLKHFTPEGREYVRRVLAERDLTIEGFDPSPPPGLLRRLWRRMTPHAAHLAAQRPTPAPTEES